MFSFSELQKMLEQEIQQLSLSDKPVELYEPIRYILKAGGKRIRPVLVLAAYNLFRNDIERAMFPAMAIEVFHNFTLLHDDIMDKADLRRNRPTVHKKWNENVAILSGDAMLIKAYDLIVQSPHEALIPILDLFNKTALQVCEGQQFDMNFEDSLEVSEEHYLEMIRLKTSVLVAASLKIGALCAGANLQDADKLYDFGLKMGLAFQIQDDFLDTFGSAEKFGKKIGGDIVANKKTYLLIKSLAVAPIKEKEELISLYSKNDLNESDKIQAVTAIFNKLNIQNLVKQKMESYYQLAMGSLHSVDVEHSKKNHLVEFASNLMIREN